MKNSERIIFVLRDEKLREAKPDEITDNIIPPEVLEVIILRENGVWTNFFPDPLGR